jgi:hypothetical protein
MGPPALTPKKHHNKPRFGSVGAESPMERRSSCVLWRAFFQNYGRRGGFNSLTAKSVPAGTKNSRPVGFYSRNSTENTLHHKHTIHKHYHHGGAVHPSFGVGSMDPPDRTRVISSEGVGRGGGGSE